MCDMQSRLSEFNLFVFYVIKVWEAVTYELVDEIILGFCFEMHRSCKRGTLFLDELDDEYVIAIISVQLHFLYTRYLLQSLELA